MQDGTSMKRRLAAILAADIAGYSRLMAPTNCAGTVRESGTMARSGRRGRQAGDASALGACTIAAAPRARRDGPAAPSRDAGAPAA
jgi:hypothetical protein